MKHEQFELALKLMVELRKELVTSQRIRTQVTGFKIAFVSSGIGLIAAYLNVVPSQLLAIPAFAAIFFDLLINSYSFSIKRIGFYCRIYIEPILRAYSEWPEAEESPLWEEFMSRPGVKQNLARSGNLGITGIAVVAAVFAAFIPFSPVPSVPILILLGLLVIYDIDTYRWPYRYPKKWQEELDVRFFVKTVDPGILLKPARKLEDCAGIYSKYGKVEKVKREIDKFREEYYA